MVALFVVGFFLFQNVGKRPSTPKDIDKIKITDPWSETILKEDSVELTSLEGNINVSAESDGEELREMARKLVYVMENAKFESASCWPCRPPGAACEKIPKRKFLIKHGGKEVVLKRQVHGRIRPGKMFFRVGDSFCISGSFYNLESLEKENDPNSYFGKIWEEFANVSYIHGYPFTSPEEELGRCEVEGDSNIESETEERRFSKIIVVHGNFKKYRNFTLEETTVRYEEMPPREGLYSYAHNYSSSTETSFTMKLLSGEGNIIKSYKVQDPRRGKSNFRKRGDFYIPVPYRGGTKIIKFFDPEEGPKPSPKYPYEPGGEMLMEVNLTPCLKKFCEKIAPINDPMCKRESFSTSAAMIKGWVKGPRGEPIEGIKVNPIDRNTAVTDENGYFEITTEYKEKLTPGRHYFYLRPPYELNLRPSNEELLASGHEVQVEGVEIINVTLEECSSIDGKVTDTEGNPITKAWVVKGGPRAPRYQVLKSGKYFLRYLDPGTHEVSGFAKINGTYIDFPHQEVTVDAGETKNVDFVVNISKVED